MTTVFDISTIDPEWASIAAGEDALTFFDAIRDSSEISPRALAATSYVTSKYPNYNPAWEYGYMVCTKLAEANVDIRPFAAKVQSSCPSAIKYRNFVDSLSREPSAQ